MNNKFYISKLVIFFEMTQKEKSNKNSERLIKLLDFWLHDFFILYDSKIKLPNKPTMDLEDYANTLEIGNNIEANLFTPKNRYKHFIWNILSKIPIKYGILPGGAFSLIDKIRSNILFYKLYFLNFNIDLKSKELFLNYSFKVLNHDMHFALMKCIPDFFFYSKVDISFSPNIYKGSMINFFQDPWNKLLFFDKNILLIGYVHGGCYGEFKSSRLDEFEMNFSNKYYGWGLHNRNIVQNRFKVIKPEKRMIENTAWISPVYVNNLISESYYPGYTLMKKESLINQKNIIPKIVKKKPIWIMHPRQRSKNNLYVNSLLFNELRINDVNQTLFVLDVPGHTFMYKAIYESIPFILFFNLEWKRFLTPNYIIFLDKLHDLKILFWWDEEECFVKRINEISYFDNNIFLEARRHLDNVNTN